MFFKISAVNILVIFGLIFSVKCLAEESPLPDFYKWAIVQYDTPDINKDGQADLRIIAYCDANQMLCSNLVLTYSMLDSTKKEPCELVIWLNLTRDKDRGDLIVKVIARFYVKPSVESNSFCFVQKKVLFRPAEATEEVTVKYIEPGSVFENLLLTMLTQAGLSMDKAVMNTTWTWYPEEPAE